MANVHIDGEDLKYAPSCCTGEEDVKGVVVQSKKKRKQTQSPNEKETAYELDATFSTADYTTTTRDVRRWII